ncbi:MAG: DUF917 domain-containing protein [Chloroflexi bacterium]|nr:DUF917 domain-containing protein [Chloroflexota bacterium]
MKILNRQNLYDILHGATILGSGGGGSLANGLKLIDSALDMGKEFRLVDFSEVPGEAWVAVPYGCGSVSPPTRELEARFEALPQLEEPPAYHAYKALEEYFGEELYGVLPTEMGGGNTAEAFYTAALLGKNIVDADPAGRAVPELIQSTFSIYGLPIHPMAVASLFGDVVIIPQVVNDERAEALVRSMAVASKNLMGVVDHPAQAKVMRNAVILGTVSRAWQIGRMYREAIERDIPASEHVARSCGGFPLFEGAVSNFRYETVDGFTVGETEMTGTGKYEGQTYRVWFKNENLMSWRNSEADVTAPDLICIFDSTTNAICENPHLRVGQKVSVIGFPAPDEWRSSKGLELLSPRRFGFDVEYTPIEKLYEG